MGLERSTLRLLAHHRDRLRAVEYALLREPTQLHQGLDREAPMRVLRERKGNRRKIWERRKEDRNIIAYLLSNFPPFNRRQKRERRI